MTFPNIGHKLDCTCRRCTSARASWGADEAVDLAAAAGVDPGDWLRKAFADYDAEPITVGFDGSRRRPDDTFTFTTAERPDFQRVWGNRWVTSEDQIVRPRIVATTTSDPDGTVVHVITTL